MAVRRSDVVWFTITAFALAGGVVVWFDVPVRLFGSHGGDRLGAQVAQMQAQGCMAVIPVSVAYAGRAIQEPVSIAQGTCAVVLAAGGEGMMHVSVDLFAPWGLRVASSGPAADAAVRQCGPPGEYRAEIRTIPDARVAFAVLACPP